MVFWHEEGPAPKLGLAIFKTFHNFGHLESILPSPTLDVKAICRRN